MDIKTLCLGLLCDGDASGYDLKKQFETTFKHFYPAGYGSIYPSLADLAHKGLVSCQEVPQDKKPDRKVYHITDAGRRAFTASLAQASPEHKLRSEYLVAMYFADFLEPERLETMLKGWNQSLNEAVARLDAVEQDIGPNAAPGARFVLGFGKALATAMATYINENQEMLVPAPEVPAVSGRPENQADQNPEAKPKPHNVRIENRV